MSTNKYGGIRVETVAGSPAPDKRLMIDAPGDNEWTARAKDNSTRPVEGRRGRP